MAYSAGKKEEEEKPCGEEKGYLENCNLAYRLIFRYSLELPSVSVSLGLLPTLGQKIDS